MFTVVRYEIFHFHNAKNFIDFSHMINDGNRSEWSPTQSVISQNRTTAKRESDLSVKSMILGVKKLVIARDESVTELNDLLYLELLSISKPANISRKRNEA